MNTSKISRIMLGVAAAACAGIFAAKLAGGSSAAGSFAWIAAALLLGVLAIALRPKDEKSGASVIASGVVMVAALMMLSYTLAKLPARQQEAELPEPTAAPAEVITEEPTEEPTEAPTPLPHISWTEEHYVDDFNDPTDETYLRGRFVGTFSNSASSGSRLDVYLYFDKVFSGATNEYFKIRLFEYGDDLVEFNIPEKKDILVKIKADGAVYEAHPDKLSEKDIYISRSSSIFDPIISALNSEKEVQVVITESRYATSTYRFTIDSYGLNELDHNWISTDGSASTYATPETPTEEPTPTPSLKPTNTPKPQMEWHGAGMYKVGQDIPAGEYFLKQNGSISAYFAILKDSSGTLDSIIANDNFNTFRYVKLKDGEYLEVDRAVFIEVENAPEDIIDEDDREEGIAPEGMYKIGRDLPAGEYKVICDDDMAYIEVAKDSRHKSSSIVSNDNFSSSRYIKVKNGQYLTVIRGHIVLH